MSTTPLEPDSLEMYARWFQALADPTRILIVRFLAQQSVPVPAGVIVDHLQISQPTVSHHLKTLHQARLLTRRRSGANILYAVNDHCVTELPHAASALLGAEPPLPATAHRPRETGAEQRTTPAGSGLPST